MPLLGYIDPGSGQLIWQALVAVAIGLLFYLKKTREFLGRLVSRLFKKD